MKKIIIVTGTGGHLGTGHFQRMVNLAMVINREQNLSASIFLPHNNERSLTEKFKDLLIENIPAGTDLIIRDMREGKSDGRLYEWDIVCNAGKKHPSFNKYVAECIMGSLFKNFPGKIGGAKKYKYYD